MLCVTGCYWYLKLSVATEISRTFWRSPYQNSYPSVPGQRKMGKFLTTVFLQCGIWPVGDSGRELLGHSCSCQVLFPVPPPWQNWTASDFSLHGSSGAWTVLTGRRTTPNHITVVNVFCINISTLNTAAMVISSHAIPHCCSKVTHSYAHLLQAQLDGAHILQPLFVLFHVNFTVTIGCQTDTVMLH